MTDRFRLSPAAREILADADEVYVSAAHAVGVQALPAHHADPFDRLLVAQAMHEPLRLLTADPLLVPYSELVVRL